ncbi:MAG: DUF4139 domain-containing protein [Candidatus Eisenbacteria bacterium]
MRLIAGFRLRAALATFLSLTALPALAAGPRVTVYSRDLGFVRETRSYELAAASDTVRFTDVSERIDFASARLAPADASRVTRLAYRYDVASGDALVESARGSRVRVTSRDERVTEGTLIAADGSWLVVRADDGSLHTVSRGAVETVRLAKPPASLSLRPTLEAVIEGGKRGRAEAELSYLTGGLSWGAEHVLVRRGEGRGTWVSRVTIDNTTGRDYVDASVKLVAGEPHRAGRGMPRPMEMAAQVRTSAADAVEKADMGEETFAEYHLYTLDRPATLRDRETQSLTMYDSRDIKMKPRYLYRGGDAGGVRTQIELVNDAASGLGMALPGGRVRIFETDASGDVQFTGESTIGHRAAGEKLTLEVGRAFDLVGERREVFNRRISDREREYQVEIKLRNRKKSAVTIVVEESAGGDIEVTQKTHPFERKDANTLKWEIPVPAGKEVVMTYTVRVRY